MRNQRTNSKEKQLLIVKIIVEYSRLGIDLFDCKTAVMELINSNVSRKQLRQDLAYLKGILS